MAGRAAAPLSKSPAPQIPKDDRVSFLRLVSHELRTPLNSIIGFSELLSAQSFGPLGAEQYIEYAEIIRESGQKMLKLVNEVLEIIRLRDGLARIEPQPGEAAFPIHDACDLVRGEAREKGVSVRLEEEEDAETCAWIEARSLRTVAHNLLQNAVEASDPGGEVVVRLRRRGPQVVVMVLDRGPGIAPPNIERVLRPFEQGDYALTRSTNGAGLGLPIAQLLCEAMGAELRLYNRSGGGLSASVRLRAAEIEQVAAPSWGA